ncbi:MAG: biopolymer transport protein ExbD [Verrucomicrobiales bacterium]|jgi:biopolymer transport protein ExbD
MPRSKKDLFGGSKPVADMSSMIDLVFLLLIFFMVASKMIKYVKDENVQISVAKNVKVADPSQIKGRVVVNIYEDDTIHISDAQGSHEISLRDIQTMMAEAKARDSNTKLLVRAHFSMNHKRVREVITASARAGVVDIIFATLKEDGD